MNFKKIKAVYFSPTGNVAIISNSLASSISKELNIPVETISITNPAKRVEKIKVESDELVVMSTPTYAGKVPNKILPEIKELFECNKGYAVATVAFGNRSFDNSLAELKKVLEDQNMTVFAGAALVTEHVFSDKLATGRPNDADKKEIEEFGKKVALKIKEGKLESVVVDGDADAPYYVPKGVDGNPAMFLKAKPKTNTELCINCGACAKACPVGSISKENVTEVVGPCIKCQACIKTCPKKAKYLDDEAFLSHVKMLEMNFTAKKDNKFFI